MGGLSTELEMLKRGMAGKIPRDARDVMEKAMTKLVASGIDKKALKEGDKVPDFILPSAKGDSIELRRLLNKGLLVIAFYRGQWCPFCNLELQALQRILPQIEERGASLIAISPNLPDKSILSQKEHNLTFEVLSDVGNKVARKFGIVFKLPDEMIPVYKSLGIDVPAANGDDSWELPIPAVYVVAPSGIIKFAHIKVDYTTRLEPSDIIEHL
jgi:peroxiredoxin